LKKKKSTNQITNFFTNILKTGDTIMKKVMYTLFALLVLSSCNNYDYDYVFCALPPLPPPPNIGIEGGLVEFRVQMPYYWQIDRGILDTFVSTDANGNFIPRDDLADFLTLTITPFRVVTSVSGNATHIWKEIWEGYEVSRIESDWFVITYTRNELLVEVAPNSSGNKRFLYVNVHRIDRHHTELFRVLQAAE